MSEKNLKEKAAEAYEKIGRVKTGGPPRWHSMTDVTNPSYWEDRPSLLSVRYAPTLVALVMWWGKRLDSGLAIMNSDDLLRAVDRHFASARDALEYPDGAIIFRKVGAARAPCHARRCRKSQY